MTTTESEPRIQDLTDIWWGTVEPKRLEPGRLVWTFIPYPDVLTHCLVITGRQNARDHSTATFKVEPFRPGARARRSQLPVAALPTHPGESYIAQRGKVRPAVVLSMGGPEIPRAVSTGGPGYQRKSCVLVAPFLGADQDGRRGGFSPEFLKRIRLIEYPQYLMDSLPLKNGPEISILRLDHVLAVGCADSNFDITEHRLSEEALEVMLDWFQWLVEGTIPANGLLELARDEMLEIEAVT